MSSMAQRLREDAQRHCQQTNSYPQQTFPPTTNPFQQSWQQTTAHEQAPMSSNVPPGYSQPMVQQQYSGGPFGQQQPIQQQSISMQQHQPAVQYATTHSMQMQQQPHSIPIQQQQYPQIPLQTHPVDVNQVRNDWRKHGVNLSQALEDVRNSRNPCHLRVRVTHAVERKDAIDQPYTAYVIQLQQQQQNTTVERRYSDFWKFKETSDIRTSVPFPAKSTAFYKRKETLIADRVKQLDAWLVHAVVEYNHGRIQDSMGFLAPTALPLPFQRFEMDNDILNLHAVVQILQTAIIPVDLWRTSVGLFIYTSHVPSLRGILIARRPQNSWAAPIAIQTIGVSRSSIVIITKESLIRDVCHGTRLDLGATQDALVPVGIEQHLTAVVTSVRANANAKFYGKQVNPLELLQTDGPTHIPAARMVYEVLQQMQLSG